MSVRPTTYAFIALGVVMACQAESPPIVTGSPPDEAGPGIVRVSELVAGPAQPRQQLRNPYEGQSVALAQGKRYYNWFNCTGCHGGRGGGGIGPPLADTDWIYGGEPANIFLSIVQGRPNGMPSFGGQVSDDQVWKMVTYVRSLSKSSGPEGATAEQPGGEGGGGGESGSLEGRPQDRRGSSGEGGGGGGR
ncbi:MAG: c-type cytochrome [Gemmatimonadales bacterium]